MKCSTCCGGFLLAIAILVAFVDVYDLIVEAIPYVPTVWVGKGIAYWCYLYSVHILKALERFGVVQFEDCFEDDEKRVVLVLAKGGLVFSFGLMLDVVTKCGITLGADAVDSGLWPVPPMNTPEHDMDLYFAMAVPTYWETKMPKDKFACVAVTRDPLERLMSMYKYGRDGAESGLLPHASVMRKMNTTEERVRYAWRYYMRGMMEEAHDAMMKAINNKNCVQVKVDTFFKGGNAFEEASKEFLDGLGVKKSAQKELLEVFKTHDISGNKDNHSHSSGKKLEVGEEKEARKIVANTPEIMEIINKQRKELKYT